MSREILMADDMQGEQWQAGDIVLAGDRGIWVRASKEHVKQGRAWGYGPNYAPQGGHAIQEGSFGDHYPRRPLTLLVRDGKSVVQQVQDLLLAQGGEFDDDHTSDAHQLAEVAKLVGLEVVYEPCDECSGQQLPRLMRNPGGNHGS